MLKHSWLNSFATQWEVGNKKKKNHNNYSNDNNNGKQNVNYCRSFGYLNFFFNFDFVITSKPKPRPLSPTTKQIRFVM